MLFIYIATVLADVDPAYKKTVLQFSDTVTSDMCATLQPGDDCLNGIWMAYEESDIYLTLFPDAPDTEPAFHYFITNSDITESYLRKLVTENKLLFFIPFFSYEDSDTTAYYIYLQLFSYGDAIRMYRNVIVGNSATSHMSYDISKYKKISPYDDTEVIIVSTSHPVTRFAHYFNDILNLEGDAGYNFAKLHYMLQFIVSRVMLEYTTLYAPYVMTKLTNTIDNVKQFAEAHTLIWDASVIEGAGKLFTNNGKTKKMIDVFNDNDVFTLTIYQFYDKIVSNKYRKSMNDMCAVVYAYVTPPPEPTPAQTINPTPVPTPTIANTPAQTLFPNPTPPQTVAPVPTLARTLPPEPTPPQTIPPIPTTARTLPPEPTPAQTIAPIPTPAQTIPPPPTKVNILPSPTPAQTLYKNAFPSPFPTPTPARTLYPTPSPARTLPPSPTNQTIACTLPPPPTPAQTLPASPSEVIFQSQTCTYTISQPSKTTTIVLATLTGTFGLSTILLAIFSYLIYHRLRKSRAVSNEDVSEEDRENDS